MEGPARATSATATTAVMGRSLRPDVESGRANFGPGSLGGHGGLAEHCAHEQANSARPPWRLRPRARVAPDTALRPRPGGRLTAFRAWCRSPRALGAGGGARAHASTGWIGPPRRIFDTCLKTHGPPAHTVRVFPDR